MKLGLISKELRTGSGQGIYEYAYNLYENLRDKCDIETITSSKHSGFFKNFLTEQIKIPSKTFFKKCDVYHAVSPEDGCWIPTIKHNSVVTFHDIFAITDNVRHPVARTYSRVCLKMASKAKAIITALEFVRQDTIKYFKIPEERVINIPLGVDHDKFKPAEKKEKQDILKIGYLGGFGKRKHVDIIIKAFSRLNEKNVQLVLGGKGPLKEYLESLTKKLGIQDKVIFPGFIPDSEIVKFYQDLDLFIWSSYPEGFGVPLLEAMSCGLPVITAKTQAAPEVAGDAGLSAEPRNPESLAEQMKVITDEKRLRDVANKCLKRSQLFSWKRCANESMKVYEDIINKKI